VAFDDEMALFDKVGLAILNQLARLGQYTQREIRYGEEPHEVLDWYMVNPASPTVVFYYGGDWRLYRKENFRFVADTLCSFGVNVMIPEFCKYPEHRFDQILAGVVKATDHFLREVYPSGPVIMMGHSSGAHKAALVTLNKTLLAQNHRIDAMIGMSGPYDFYPFTQDDHWDLFGPEANYPLSQPINYVRPDAPELYLLHGADDTRVRRGHSKSLMEKQIAAGGLARREVYENMGHADAVVSFSRIHRRNSKLIHDIQSFIHSRI
jgi:acetyl esterase/lipase